MVAIFCMNPVERQLGKGLALATRASPYKTTLGEFPTWQQALLWRT